MMDSFNAMYENVHDIYFERGSRSSKKVDCVHEWFRAQLEPYLPEGFYVSLEHNVPSINTSGKKRCDIVVFDSDNDPIIIFPVKAVMTNYKQNGNNQWENLTGEVCHLKWANENIHIVPINILMNKVPYLKDGGEIKTMEHITYEKSYEIYSTLVTKHICTDVLNYIVDVEHNSKIGEKYDKKPTIIGFNEKTPWKDLDELLFNCGIIRQEFV